MTDTADRGDRGYLVIARRFRPQRFAEIVGQDPIVRTLANEVREDRTPHAWLFAGMRGVGKTTTARILAKALNCARRTAEEPCDECPACADIVAGRSLDVLEIDGASNRGIDQIRELRETVRSYPARDRFRVLIIDEVHMLTREAFNALLKTLEEPPAHVRFVLATTELHKVPDTIASRCQVFEFRAMSLDLLERELGRIAAKEGITITPRGLKLLARAAGGSLRDGQSQLDQAIACCGRAIDDNRLEDLLGLTNLETLRRFLAAVAERDTAALLRILDSLLGKGADPVQFCRDLQAYLRDLILVRAGAPGDPGTLLLETDPEEAARLAGRLPEDQLLRIFHLLVQEEPAIRHSPHPRYLLEVLAVKIARLADLTPIERLLAEIGAGGEAPEGPEPAPERRRAGPVQGSLLPPPEAESRTPPAEERPDPSPAAATEPEEGRGNPAGPPLPSLSEALLHRLEERKASLSAFLGRAARIETEADPVRIVFSERQSFSRETIARKENLAILEQVCREVLGRPVRVVVHEEKEPTLDLARVDDANHRRTRENHLLEQAMQEPGVQAVLDTFQGEIVDIREAEPQGS